MQVLLRDTILKKIEKAEDILGNKKQKKGIKDYL